MPDRAKINVRKAESMKQKKGTETEGEKRVEKRATKKVSKLLFYAQSTSTVQGAKPEKKKKKKKKERK